MTVVSHPRRRISAFVSLIALGVVAALAGCGAASTSSPVASSTSPAAPASTTTQPTTASSSPTPTIGPTTLPQAGRSRMWVLSTPSGLRESVNLVVSAPTRQGTLAPVVEGTPLPATCSFNPSTDAFVFLSLAVTALTEGKDTPLSVMLKIDAAGYAGSGTAPAPDDGRIRVFIPASDDAVCLTRSTVYQNGQGVGASWSDPVPRNGREVATWGIIIRDYYSAATPGGDLGLLKALTLTPAAAYASDDKTAANTYAVEAPGVLSLAGEPSP